MENVVILSAQRTAVGAFGGALAQIPAPKLGAIAIKAAVHKVGLAPTDIQECIMGEVLTAGVGQAPARQAAIFAGLPTSVVCMTVNKVCGSGLKAVMLAADSIQLGNCKIAVAGGQENMSLAPHLLENQRTGYRMGNVTISDSMVKDGLWDPYNNWHMGSAGELCAREKNFSREEQDNFAKSSYTKAQKAISDGAFKNEIVAVEIQDRKGVIQFATDEDPGKANFEKMAGLKPAFEKTGTITAANASKLNDGAAAIVLTTETEAKSRGKKPLAKIIGSATFAQDPKWFTTAPVGAMKAVLDKTGLKVSDIDLWEINEAFSVVTQVAVRELEIPLEKVNVFGGAVAIGHPIGASGARLLTTLVHGLHSKQKRYGLVSLCIGGGEAVAMIVERI